jgi:hypothetical protein
VQVADAKALCPLAIRQDGRDQRDCAVACAYSQRPLECVTNAAESHDQARADLANTTHMAAGAAVVGLVLGAFILGYTRRR